MYAYQADIYCDDCAEEIIRQWPLPACTCRGEDAPHNALAEGIGPDGVAHSAACPLCDWTAPEDSGEYPQKDTSSGETDSPQHCADCGEFLQNPLTDDGYRYVQEQLNAQGCATTLQTWANFYGFTFQGWTTDQCALD